MPSLAWTNSSSSTTNRMLQQSEQGNHPDDATGYQPRIWSTGDISQAGDEAEGSGPYLPFWQVRVSKHLIRLVWKQSWALYISNILVHNNLQPDHLR
jgi:hypothetical protein